uniref:Uncharacterized protein n=1 Tax=Setaria digitata TaxID=48799 RepID=A0A915Q0I2_9BILA
MRRKSGISREIVDDGFNKSLKKAINNTQLVKGEISDEEFDAGVELQRVSVNKIMESFTKILLENDKVDCADVNIQMSLKNVKNNPRKRSVRFLAYETYGADERGGRIMCD